MSSPGEQSRTDASSGRGPGPRIRTPDQRLRIFVSSTLRELAAERAAVRSAIESIRLTPVMFELGARPHPPRDLYRAYLEQSEVFVGIYWQQYGWIAPDEQISGLEDEYRLSADHPRLVYVREPAPSRDHRLGELLEEMQSGGLSYRHFGDADELAEAVSVDLAVLLSERFEVSGHEDGHGDDDGRPVFRVPSVPSRFIGREQAIEDVGALLRDPQTRLLDLVGPGGTGKTRLALEVARSLRSEFRDGVVSVMLAPVRSPELVPTSIMAALRMPEIADRSPVAALASFLADREILLVLDNFEHLVDAAPVLVELLAASAEVKLLVTSREVLHVTGEVVYQVPPLQLPPDAASDDELAASESVELFLERARAAGRELAVDGESLAVVAQICRRLEGIPLAIELAAARTRVFDPAEILARLDHSLGLLTGGPRDLPRRQQALHLTIQWSYDLLPEPERALFEVLVCSWGASASGPPRRSLRVAG